MSDREKAWLRSGDTGASSKCIFSVLTGHYMPELEQDDCYPRDPSDFGRCFRLTNLMGWRDRLHEVAAACPWFAPFVREWDEMSRLYNEELPGGKAPRLYDLMQRLVEEAMILTGWRKTRPSSWERGCASETKIGDVTASGSSHNAAQAAGGEA